MEFNRNYCVSLILRVGLAIVFLYPAVLSVIDPNSWVGFIPSWITDLINPITFLHIHAVFEFLLVAWFLSNWKVKYPAIIAIIFTISIILTNLPQFPILFRDLAIIFMALALAVLEWKK